MPFKVIKTFSVASHVAVGLRFILFLPFFRHVTREISSRNVITISFAERTLHNQAHLLLPMSPSSDNGLEDTHKKFNEMTLNNSDMSHTSKYNSTLVFARQRTFSGMDDLHFPPFFSRCCLCLSFTSAVYNFYVVKAKKRRTLFFIITWCHFRSECHTQARRRFVRRNARCEIESDCATNWMVFWCLEINYPDSAAQEFPWKTLFPLVARFKVMRSGLRCLFTLSRACVSKRPKKLHLSVPVSFLLRKFVLQKF